jgi:hypothetical protein
MKEFLTRLIIISARSKGIYLIELFRKNRKDTPKLRKLKIDVGIIHSVAQNRYGHLINCELSVKLVLLLVPMKAMKRTQPSDNYCRLGPLFVRATRRRP